MNISQWTIPSSSQSKALGHKYYKPSSDNGAELEVYTPRPGNVKMRTRNSETRASKAAIGQFLGESEFPGASEKGHRKTDKLILDGLFHPSRSLKPG